VVGAAKVGTTARTVILVTERRRRSPWAAAEGMGENINFPCALCSNSVPRRGALLQLPLGGVGDVSYDQPRQRLPSFRRRRSKRHFLEFVREVE
jgi:hypothetical protein